MSKLRCKVCGGQIEMQVDDRGICLGCGARYSLESMKKMLGSHEVSMASSSSSDLEKWWQLLEKYYSASDFASAEDAAKRILECTPDDKDANFVYNNIQVMKYFDIRNGIIKGYNSTVGKITLPNTIKRIEAGAFENNEYIEEITLPNSIDTIEEAVFKNCKKLKHVNLPAGLKTISAEAFAGCEALETIKLPETIKRIGGMAFMDCKSLTSIALPASLEEIEVDCFASCSSLSTLSISEGLTSIGSEAFIRCTSLENVIIPQSVKNIGGYAFSQCSNLASVELPALLQTIETGVFDSCRLLTSLTIPEGTSIIKDEAFRNCISLRKILIPPSVKTVGAFSEDSYYRREPYQGAFQGCGKLSEVIFTEGLLALGDNTFSQCDSLKILELPNGLKNIGKKAFSFCKSLEKVSIPDSVISPEDGWMYKDYSGYGFEAYPWAGCDNLSEIIYPERFSLNIFEGTKYFQNVRRDRLKRGFCPVCNQKLSLLYNRCPSCHKIY